MKSIYLIAIVFVYCIQMRAQCPYDNTFWADLTPTAAGNTQTELCAYAGDFYTVNVVAGETYVFSTCNSLGGDSELTLFTSGGGSVITSNDDDCGFLSTITWTATLTGTVDLLIDEWDFLFNPCQSGTTCYELNVTWVNPSSTSNCINMSPICTNAGLNFNATATGQPAAPGNNYGCLTTQPDPTWYYFEISASGNINMQLSAASDIDYAIWGPYANLAAAQAACGTLPLPIDCSYDPAAIEFPVITSAVVGQVYIMIITNYAGVNQPVTLQQTGGTGATNCAIVTCNADAGTVTANMSNNNSNNYYLCYGDTLSVVSNNDFVLPTSPDVPGLGYAIYACPPTTNNPDTDPCWTGYYWTAQDFTETNDVNSVYDFILANPQLGFAAASGNVLYWVPITMDDIATTTSGGADDNLGHDIDSNSCFSLGTPLQVNYLNPITATEVLSCGPPISLTVTITGGYPEFVPAGTYTVSNTGAGSIAQSGAQGQTITITGLNNGDLVSFSVTTDANGCTYDYTYTVVCSGCAANAGTVTTLVNGVAATSPLLLCKGDCFDIFTDSNFTLPPPEPGEESELMFAIYNGPPNLATEPDLDPNFSGLFWTGDSFTDCNDATSTIIGAALPTNFWMVPITMDDSDNGANPNGIINYDQNGDGCFALGTPVEVVYLDSITATIVESCSTTTFILDGGFPNYNVTGVYTVANTGAGTYVQNGAAGDTLIFSGYTPGQTLSFNVSNDGNGCATSFTHATQELPSITLDTIIDADCNGANTGAIDITIEGDTTDCVYTLDMFDSFGDGWEGSNIDVVVNGVNAGNYTVAASNNSATINVPNGQTLELIYNYGGGLFEADVTYNLDLNGATIFSDGPTPSIGSVFTTTCVGQPIVYSTLWSNGANSEDISGLVANNYTVTVTDPRGCTVSGGPYTVNEQSSLLVTIDSVVNTACSGSNGMIYQTTSGGAGPYNYLWSNGATTEDISALSASTYTVTVTDNNFCTASSSANVSNTSAGTIDFTITNPSCNGAADGCIQATYTGGGSNLGFSWSTTASTDSICGLLAGNYTITVTDTVSMMPLQVCTIINDTTLVEPTSLAISIDTLIDASCQLDNGSVAVTVTGGTPSYTYSWSNTASTSALSGLAAGLYTVTVTDSNACTDTLSLSIAQLGSVVASAVVSSNYNGSDVSCNGATDATVTATGTGGATPYTYLWNNSATTNTISGLGTGLYRVTMTDANGCTSASFVTVTEPFVVAVSIDTVAAVVCVGSSNGFVNVSTSGGTAPYSYLWSNGDTAQNATGLTDSTYTVLVTDANGCTTSDTVDVSTVGFIQVVLDSIVDVACNGDSSGAVYVSTLGDTSAFDCSSPVVALNEIMYRPIVRNGQEPYTGEYIELIGPPGANIGCYVLSDGDWTITIPPGTTIPADGFYTIGNDSIWGQGAMDLDAENCACFTDGIGGQGLLILTDGGEYVAMFDATGTFVQGLVYGSPSVANTPSGQVVNTIGTAGCVSSVTMPAVASFETASSGFSPGTSLIRSPDGTGTWGPQVGGSLNGCNNTGNNSNSGTITYVWSNGDTTQHLTGVAAGVYSVTATNAYGCTTTETYTVTESAPLSLAASSTAVVCAGDSTGTITTSTTGNYSYLWNTAETTANLSNLAAGLYSLTFTDTVTNCQDTINVLVQEPDSSVQVSVQNTIDVSCNGGSDGSLTVQAAGGTAGYSYQWLPGGSTSSTASGLTAGLYSVTVTDSNACTVVASYTVNEASAILVSSTATAVGCNSSNDGTATAVPSGGTPGYSYLWDVSASSQTTATASGLTSSTYSVTVTDTLGCTAVVNGIFVAPSTPLDTTDVPMQVINGWLDCDLNPVGALGIVTTGNYTYLWSNGATSQTVSGLSANNYTVTISSSSGCTVEQSASVLAPFVPVLNPYINTVGQTTETVTNGTTVSIDGGNDQTLLGVNYLWEADPNVIIGNDIIHSTSALSNVTGNYVITITATSGDSAACSVSDTLLLMVQAEFAGMPDAFTPNGDGFNDLYLPVGLTVNEVVRFRVFNRWGQELYNGDALENGGWDGKYMGVEQPSEVYLYLMEYAVGSSTKIVKGEFTLMR